MRIHSEILIQYCLLLKHLFSVESTVHDIIIRNSLILQEFFYPSPVAHDTISYFQDTGSGMFWKESLVISRNHLGIDSSIVFTDSGAAYYYKYEYMPDSIFVSRYIK